MPERVRRLEETFERTPIYFVTSCTANRRQLLATSNVHGCFKAFSESAPRHGAWVGAYVLMPDHLHLFVAIDDQRINLSNWMKSLKVLSLQTCGQQRSNHPTGRRASLIMFYEVVILMQRNGITYAKTLFALVSLAIGRNGLILAKWTRWNILPIVAEFERRSQTAATEFAKPKCSANL